VIGHEATTLQLQRELDEALAALIPAGTELAFLNFPNIANPGDSAVYLGARSALERIGARVVLTCAHNDYRRRLVADAVGRQGTIVIGGGGNFGDLYRKQPQQRVRRRVLKDFPEATIIQLPQAIYFEDPRRGSRFADLCRAHPALTIMVRDAPSAERAAALGIETKVCPDLAIALGPLERPVIASRRVAWLLREDVESRDPAGTARREGRDWPLAAEQRRGLRGLALRRDVALTRGLARVRDRAPSRIRPALARGASSRYGPIARRRLRTALELAAAGEVLVTDRLHGHLLACLMGIPNVVLDNSYGKNRGVFETWSHRYAIARFADDEAAALDLAESLAAA
jgi:exopolysaccharide biosynthesis predicted pyruvyltransferase EpsI